jgi:murein L,D-transpeptidase YcbB/YkuD
MLLAHLQSHVKAMGFSEHAFMVEQISADLTRLRQLEFDDNSDVNFTMAHLEYLLSKAYLRYAIGQRFGFVNPLKLLNRVDIRDADTLGRAISYRQLFDVDMDTPDKNYAWSALRKVANDSLGNYLAECLPHDEFYDRLQAKLHEATLPEERQRLLVNMERRRWREHLKPQKDQPYVMVNVAAYQLWAVSPDTTITMRAACGALKTKTPLLSSHITRMDVNPEWIIPMSIIRDEVSHRAGDSAYFARRRYYIADRKTGNRVPVGKVSRAMLQSGRYRVSQQGGAGNSLGRIIFRFANNFDVFLHDTSSPGVFQRDNRGVSHGCVRVQQPFELARFLLGREADDWLLDRIRLSMGLKPQTEQGRSYLQSASNSGEHPVQPRLISSKTLASRVPIFITYYTLFLTPDGSLQVYPDVYGYDKVISKALTIYQQ